VQKLGLDGPFICYQGAQVRMPDGSTVLDHGIKHHLAMEVIRSRASATCTSRPIATTG